MGLAQVSPLWFLLSSCFLQPSWVSAMAAHCPFLLWVGLQYEQYPMAFEKVPSLVFRPCMTIPTSGPGPLFVVFLTLVVFQGVTHKR